MLNGLAIGCSTGCVLAPRSAPFWTTYLKYELGVVPKAFLNMEVKALGVL